MSKYLEGKRIYPLRIDEVESVVDLIDNAYANSSFQARNIAQAARLAVKMIRGNYLTTLTLAGAMTPAGMGGIVASAIRYGWIDVIITTGANVTHDLHFPLRGRVVQGSPNVDDKKLASENIERIYDTFLGPEALSQVGKTVRDFIDTAGFEGRVSTSRFHYGLGEFAKKQSYENTGWNHNSFLVAAREYGVPVYTPAFGDSEIGMGNAFRMLDEEENHKFTISPALDVAEQMALAYNMWKRGYKSGVIAIGGGSPKNSWTQTGPGIREDIDPSYPGHDLIVKNTTDVPVYGGCSGAPPEENVTWGKFNPDIIGTGEVVVHADATIVIPLIFAYVRAKCRPRTPKRLFGELHNFIELLKIARDAKVHKSGKYAIRKK